MRLKLATDTHQLARKRIRREGVELDDWFEARNEARRNKELEEEGREQEAYERQIRQRQEEAAADERRQFEKKWLSYALEHKPWDAPDDFGVVIRPEVMVQTVENKRCSGQKSPDSPFSWDSKLGPPSSAKMAQKTISVEKTNPLPSEELSGFRP